MLFNEMSWANFFIAVTATMFAYYVAVILLFYRDELKSFLRQGFKNIPGVSALAREEDKEDQLYAFKQAVLEIDSLLQETPNGISKSNLISSLRPLLKKYSGLLKEEYNASLINYTLKKAEEKCGTWVSAMEMTGDD